MLVLDHPSVIATGQVLLRYLGALFFRETHQARGQSPESQESLRGHHLTVVTAEQVLLVFEKGSIFQRIASKSTSSWALRSIIVLPQ
jgi:hypothetical protein